MANVITSFLVGIGYDTEQLRKGEREISTSMEGVKSLAGTTGAALAAAFIGVGNTAVQTAQRVNDLRLNTNQLYTSTQYVNDYGNALRSLGGNAGDAVGELSKVETALSNLRQKGDASTFTELAYYGVDTQPLTSAESGGQFMERLAQQFPSLSRQQQSGVASTLGLSPASVELLRKGSDGYRDMLNHVHEVAGLSDDLIQKSKDYNNAIGEAQNRWEGVANIISAGVLPAMTDIVNKGSDFITDVLKPMAKDNPGSTGAGLSLIGAGVASSVAGPLLSGIGMGGIGAGAAALGLPLAAAGAGVLAISQSDKIFDESQGDTAGGLLHKGSWLDKLFTKDSAGIFDTSEGDSLGGLWHSDNALSRWWKDVDTTPPMLNQNDGYYKRTFGNKKEKEQIINSSEYTPYASDNSYNSAAAVGEAVAEKLYAVPLKATVNNNVDVSVELDGHALDSKITDVHRRNNQMTVDDLQSTTAR